MASLKEHFCIFCSCTSLFDYLKNTNIFFLNDRTHVFGALG